MWNQKASNRLIHEKNQLRETKRLSHQIKNIKSTLLVSQRSSILLRTSKGKQKGSQKKIEIDRENQHMINRIRSIRSQRSCTSLSRRSDNSSILKMLQNNKLKIEEIKKKKIELQNQRMLKKLISTSSSLKKLRIQTSENEEQKLRGKALKAKSVLFLSGEPSPKCPPHLLNKKIRTQGPTNIDNSIEEIFESPEEEITIGVEQLIE